MTSSGHSESRSRISKRKATSVAAVLMVIGLGVAFYFVRPQTVEIPLVALPDMHPAVVELLQQQRERVEKRPTSSSAWGSYGMCLHQHQRLREALICYEQAMRLKPSAARWPYFAGVIQEQTDVSNALDCFEMVIRLDADFAPAVVRAAELLISTGDTGKAGTLLDAAAARLPKSAMICLLRMRLFRQTGDFEDAKELMKRATERGIRTRELMIEAARIALLQGDAAHAEELQQEAKHLPPVAILYRDAWVDDVRRFDAGGMVSSMYADQLRSSGKLQEAAGMFARIAKQFPGRSRPGLNHAMMLVEAGQVSEAVRALTDLSRRFPDDPLIRFNLAVAEFQSGNLSAAEQATRAALEIKDDFGAAWAILADILVRKDQSQEATLAFEMAVRAVPEDVDIQLAFAEHLIRDQDWKAAQRVLNNVRFLVADTPSHHERWELLNARLPIEDALH